MGFFSRKKSEDRSTLEGFKVYQKIQNGSYDKTVVGWSQLVSLMSIPEDLKTITKLWPEATKHSSQHVVKELVAISLYKTLDIFGKEFFSKNSISKNDFVKDVGSIFELSLNQIQKVSEYIEKFGAKKQEAYFNDPNMTPEKLEEFSNLKYLEMVAFLESMASNPDNLGHNPALPSKEVIEKIGEQMTMNGIVLRKALKQQGIL